MALDTQTQSIRESARTPAPFSTWFGVVLLFALFAVITAAVIGPAPRGTTYERDRSKNRMEKLKKNHDEQMQRLTEYAWVDKAKGTARIPVDRAMELTVTQLAAQSPAPAYPIASPPPPPAAAQAPAGASPAPAGSPADSKGTPRAKGQESNQSETGRQPAAAPQVPPAAPRTQPGASATPAASPPAPAAQPAQSPQPTATIGTAGTPIPVPGKSPGQP